MSTAKTAQDPVAQMGSFLLRVVRAESARLGLSPHGTFLAVEVLYNVMGTLLYGDDEQKTEAFGTANPTSADVLKALEDRERIRSAAERYSDEAESSGEGESEAPEMA